MNASQRLPEAQHRIYSGWEQEKLAAAGLRGLAMAGILAPLALLAALAVAGHDALGPQVPAFVGLFAVAVGSLVVYVRALRRGVDVERPLDLGTAILLGLSAAGAFAAVRAGGAGGLWPWGLTPAAFAWAAWMPGGLRRGFFALGGSAGLHLGIVGAAGGPGVGQVAVMVLVQAAAAAALTETLERWRLRAAGASQNDWLTGALGRKELLHRLAALVNLRQRSLEAFSLVMIDVDRFKTLNAEHGRGVGDEALELLAATVTAEVRPSDLFGRLGGDEFLIVLDQCDAEGAMTLVRRIQQRLGQTELVAHGQRVRVSFSAGILPLTPGDGMELKDLLGAAERALFESQEAARNRTAVAVAPLAVEPPPGLQPEDEGHPVQAERSREAA